MRRAWIWVLLGLLLGCSSSTKTALTSLQKSVDEYNHAFRWKNYSEAALSLPRDIRPEFISVHDDDSESLSIDDYKILRVDVESDDAATVKVRVRYHLLPSVVVERRNLIQYWHRTDGNWILETEENSIRDIARPDSDPSPENKAPGVWRQ